MARQKYMRSEALKVVSFAMTQCTKVQANEFIKNSNGLPLVFGYLMRQNAGKNRKDPLMRVQTEEEVLQDFEHCLSIIWNLIVALTLDFDPANPSEKICFERLAFKLLEGSLDKVGKLKAIHEQVYSRLEDFDLNEFKTAEEIGYLENDYNFDLLSLADCIILFTQTNDTCKRLLSD